MHPCVMSTEIYFYPIHAPIVLIKCRDELMNIDDVFGVMKVMIQGPNDLYFLLLPERLVLGAPLKFKEVID